MRHPQDIQSFAHLIDRNGCLQTVLHACMRGARVAKFEKSELLLANGTFIAISTEADERYVEEQLDVPFLAPDTAGF